ncbi:O-antigen ligase family protein [Aestuariivirga sp.]|uniref:O-antigen ligase family protein n=1 Tax=Aestuariivirga sp. TaxID=2650926 RepID=UPI0039E5B2CE
MPEHLRSLVVITVLGGGVLYMLFRTGSKQLVTPELFKSWAQQWAGITLGAFLSFNAIIYFIFLALIGLLWVVRAVNPIASWLLVVFAIPWGGLTISGGGILNQLMTVDPQRVLALTVLLPLLLGLGRQIIGRPGDRAAGRTADVLFLLYVIIVVFGLIRDTTPTNALRNSVYLVLEAILPYFVLSRRVTTPLQFRQCVYAFVVGCSIQGLIGLFEMGKGWLLYSALMQQLGLDWPWNYLGRAGALRATATFGQPIALGFVMAVAAGLIFAIREQLPRNTFLVLFGLVLAGSLASLSRGPWIGLAALFIVYSLLSAKAMQRLLMGTIAAAVVFSSAAVLPGGERIINLLPYVGNTEQDNVDYRTRLFNNSIIVISRHPWFGSENFLDEPEMQEMRQGQGIIDLVNTYLGIALSRGLVGLSVYCLFWVAILFGLFARYWSARQRRQPDVVIYRAFFAAISAALIIIATVSSITAIPLVLWMLAGLSVASFRIAWNEDAREKTPDRMAASKFRFKESVKQRNAARAGKPVPENASMAVKPR